MKTRRLGDYTIRKYLKENPMISSVEELCAVCDRNIDEIDEEDREYARHLINLHVLQLKVELKDSLYKNKTRPSIELLYKLIGDEDDLKKLGINDKKSPVSVENPVIEIKTVNPEIIDKIKEL